VYLRFAVRFAVRQDSLSNFFFHQIADAIWCAIPCPLPLPLRTPNRTANHTANCMVRVNGSNSVSDTKSQMQQIASAIYSKSQMKSHTCSQPHRVRLHTPNLCTNRLTIPCTICTQTELGANSCSVTRCHGSFTHFNQKESKTNLLDTFKRRLYAELYGDSYGKSHVYTAP
jgi:hypothetical protein